MNSNIRQRCRTQHRGCGAHSACLFQCTFDRGYGAAVSDHSAHARRHEFRNLDRRRASRLSSWIICCPSLSPRRWTARNWNSGMHRSYSFGWLCTRPDAFQPLLQLSLCCGVWVCHQSHRHRRDDARHETYHEPSHYRSLDEFPYTADKVRAHRHWHPQGRIDTASVKVWNGGPHDDKKDLKDDAITSRVWTGVVPVHQIIGEPVASPENVVRQVPASITNWIEDTNKMRKDQLIESMNE